MGQELVLKWFYEEHKKDPKGKYRTKDILKGVLEMDKNISSSSIERSMQRLCFWSFIRREIGVQGWKDSYLITPLGLSTASTWEDLAAQDKLKNK